MLISNFDKMQTKGTVLTLNFLRIFVKSWRLIKTET